MCGEDTACIVIQSPDFLGRARHPDRLRALAERTHDCGALLVVAANPISLGMLKPPASWGADIVVGEGSRWATRSALVAPISASSPAGKSTCAARADVS